MKFKVHFFILNYRDHKGQNPFRIFIISQYPTMKWSHKFVADLRIDQTKTHNYSN